MENLLTKKRHNLYSSIKVIKSRRRIRWTDHVTRMVDTRKNVDVSQKT
jgi:hypothetical protein